MPEPNRKPSLIKSAFPDQATAVFVAALAVGVALILLPLVFGPYLTIDATQSNLLLCVGIALVLAAFGGQATVQVGSIIMAGAAAICLGLFIYLQSITKDHYVLGSISGIDASKYDIWLTSRHNILGTLNQPSTNTSQGRYDFVVFERDIDADWVDVQINVKDGDAAKSREPVVRVASSYFQKGFGGGRRLDWELRRREEDNRLDFDIFDRSLRRVISQVGSEAGVTRLAANQPAEMADLGAANSTLSSLAIAAAFAQASPAQIADLIAQLKSNDTTVRRAARDALSNLGPADVPKLMAALHAESRDYRIKVGITYALSSMLRRDLQRAKAISAQLSAQDLKLLLALANDTDQTVRLYAKQFLADLRDPRARV
jgi:hypothetical protein